MVGVGRDEGVVRDEVWLGNLVEQLVGNVGQRFFGIGGDDGVEGEDIGEGGGGEGVASGGEAAALGVEEDEVVGEVGGGWDERFDV